MTMYHLFYKTGPLLIQEAGHEELIITVALTGNVPTREMNANLPVTPEEIAKDVNRCANAGASLFHVHARDLLQKPTLSPSVFMDIVQHIKVVSPDVDCSAVHGRTGRQKLGRPQQSSQTSAGNGIFYNRIRPQSGFSD